MPNKLVEKNSRNAAETINMGARLGRLLSRKDVVALIGNLGSGKTTFVKGIARGLKVKDTRYVNSPSFVIVKEYKGRLALYHFDLYRLNGPSDLDTLGYKEYFYGSGVTVVEWADKMEELLPEECLRIEFSINRRGGRVIRFIARTKRYERLLSLL